jgi:hypothetical protein
MGTCARHCNYAYTGCFHCLVEEQEQRIAELEKKNTFWACKHHTNNNTLRCAICDEERIAELEAELNQCLDCCKRVGELEQENESLRAEVNEYEYRRG